MENALDRRRVSVLVPASCVGSRGSPVWASASSPGKPCGAGPMGGGSGDKGGGGHSGNTQSRPGRGQEFIHLRPVPPAPVPATGEKSRERGRGSTCAQESRVYVLAAAPLLGHPWYFPSAPKGRQQNSPVLLESISAFSTEAKGVWAKGRGRGKRGQPGQAQRPTLPWGLQQVPSPLWVSSSPSVPRGT